MFKIILSLFLFNIVACSKNGTNQIGELKQAEDIENKVIFEALTIRTSSVSGVNTIPTATLDFATLQPKQSGTQDLLIVNGDLSALVFGASDIDSSNIAPFTVTEICSNKTILRNRSCKLTFSISNNPSPNEIVLTKSLTIKGTPVQLTATLAPDLTPHDAPVVNLSVAPTLLDFGAMKAGEVKELSIVVTNRGTSTQNINAPIVSNPKLSITSNSCSALIRNRSCTIKVRYSASNDETIVQESFTSIANNDIKYSVLVQSPTLEEPQVLAINPLTISSSVSLSEPQTQNGTLTFTNSGTISLPSPIQAIAQPSSGVTINSVSCTGGLSRGRNCSVSYSLNSALLAGGNSSVQLRLQSGAIASNIHTINLNVTKLAVPCSVSDVQANGWNTDNHLSIAGMKTGSDVSQCIVQSCNQYFSVNSLSKSCSADACTVDNAPTFGVNLSNVSSVSGNTPNCVISACSSPSLFDIAPDQKSCVDKPLDCTLADAQSNGWNITNAQTPTGIKVGSNLTQCSVSVCNTNFSLSSANKTCDAISCTLENASGNGVTSILNVATVSGNLPTCSVSSCNSNYKPAVDNLSCVAKLCNELNAGELSALGFNTTNATISGIYPSCSLSCNLSNQELAADGKSCLSVTYEPVYSSFGLCSADEPCDGQGTKTANIASCQKYLNGQPVSGGVISNCSQFPQSQSETCYSPVGTKNDPLFQNGTKTTYCEYGQALSEVSSNDITIVCNLGYLEENELCVSNFSGWKKVSTGNFHSCGVTTTNQAYCWGSNSFGQLGDNSTIEKLIPTPVNTTTGLTTTNVANIEVSSNGFSCALTITGQAYCWGGNSPDGRLGIGSGFPSSVNKPTPVNTTTGLTTTNVASISLGAFHGCAVTTTGQAYCWGLNSSGQLGDNSKVNKIIPTSVNITTGLTTTNVSFISAGSGGTCAITTIGQAYCWGYNATGQVGDNTTVEKIVPTPVNTTTGLTTTNVSSIVLDDGHTCALTKTGRLYCWGRNFEGQIGDNTTVGKIIPAAVNTTTGLTTTNVLSVDVGAYYSCAVTITGQAYCWGRNNSGQVGDNTTANKISPTPVNTTTGLTTTNVAAVSIQSSTSCAITKTGELYCWGSNTNGSFGNNSKTSSLLPITSSEP